MGLTEELKRVLKESGAALVKVSDLRKVDKCSWPRRVCSKTSDLRSSDGSYGRYYRMYHALNRKRNGIVSAGEVSLWEKRAGSMGEDHRPGSSQCGSDLAAVP